MWRSVLVKQALLVASSAVLFLALRGEDSGLAALVGGLIALLNVQLLAWRKRQSERRRGLDARSSLRAFYRSALERFGLVAALLALTLGWLKLEPLGLLMGFMIGQAAVLFMWSGQQERHRN